MATKLGRLERQAKRLDLAAKQAVKARLARMDCQGASIRGSLSDMMPHGGATKPGSVLLKGRQPYAIEREPKFHFVGKPDFKATKSIRSGSPKQWRD